MHAPLYSESQSMIGGLLLIAIIIAMLLFVAFQWTQNTRPARILSAAVLIIGGIVVTVLATMRLKTSYYTDSVEYQFGSLYTAPPEVIYLDSVTSVRILTYNPSDYGGWGMKGNESTRVYNASGDKGILFTLKRGKKLLLGTQEPDSLRAKLIGHYPIH